MEEVDLLKVRFIWCRWRFCGFGFVEIFNKDKLDEIIIISVLNNIIVGGKWVRVKLVRNEMNLDEEKNELYVLGFGDFVNEDILWESFFYYFDILENDIGKVNVIWERVNIILEMMFVFKMKL